VPGVRDSGKERITANNSVVSNAHLKTYAIRWKCSATGRLGAGTTLFEKAKAEQLAKQLNEEYPDIDHEAVIRVPSSPEVQSIEAIKPPSS
jgi:hypothetical protein